ELALPTIVSLILRPKCVPLSLTVYIVQHRRVEVALNDGTRHLARIVAEDRHLDIAALSIDAHGLPTAPLGESVDLKPGHLVFAAGHPWGVEGAVAAGVVIAVSERRAEFNPTRREMIAVGLNLRPGNSGGPLADAQGRLVGINTMLTGPSVGLAVPVHVVKRFLKNALGSRAA
ncbi:MAG: trypsin-like peptidase domain-containing protein, partial [SAR202 cluster bacterium]|nr:trypsin-like peptidase domain-containing protein [SAR202 cluster bacterium]